MQSRRGRRSQAVPLEPAVGQRGRAGAFASDLQLSRSERPRPTTSVRSRPCHVIPPAQAWGYLFPAATVCGASRNMVIRAVSFGPAHFNICKATRNSSITKYSHYRSSCYPDMSLSWSRRRAIYFLAAACQYLACDIRRKRNLQSLRLGQTRRKWLFNSS